ncbi:MAG: glycosyl transferase family 36 [Anaerolineae bacterium]|nr:glycosyl transferase family 36 [Anaerolineae bacterium]
MTDTPNPYGYFDPVNREYVITRPDTPTPWLNYLGEGRYGGIISNTAGGYSFDRDPRSRRVTRYRYNGVPADQPGRYVYLRDQESGLYWSPTWQPVVERRLESYECRHGAGYTRIRSVYGGIAAELLYFVPPLAHAPYPCELWVLRVKNAGPTPRRLRTFSYAEFSYYDAVVDQTNLDWGMHIVRSRYQDGIIYTSTQFRPTVTFFSSSRPPLGFDTDREVFVGRYRDLSNPIVVESGQPTGSEAPRGNNIGSLCHELLLAPGEESEIVYILGVTDDGSSIPEIVAHYRQEEHVRAAFEALRADWERYLSCFVVETPDPEMNAMLNFWNPVQCRANLYWSRFVSGYDTGLGRGMGTRDSAQDTLGTVHSLPTQARSTLTTLWRLQFRDGHTWHQVFPLTGEGGPGLAAEFPGWPQWFSDDHLWLVIATCAYLRETGDLAYLEENVPYQDGGEDTVWGHMLRAVDFTLAHRGPHGLPRLGFSDWDDTMNLDHGSGKAESVWSGEQFCRAMLDLAELCQHLGREQEADRFLSLHREMAEIINRTSWDGAWYVRAYDDEGLPVGVEREQYHKINLNPQTWAVIGEIGDFGCEDGLERQIQAMEQAHEKLNTPFGLRLMWPPYDTYLPRVQGTSTFPPGAKENGGIFCHANTWAVVAAAKLGWGDRAYQYYRQFLPLARTDADRYLVEPYVYCQNICGPEHPQYGMGRNSWLTGTASWAYVAATQWLLGIRPTFKGLRIAPVLPSDWAGFSARRVFRGVTYHIVVERVGPGNEVALTVDGKPVEGDIVPLPPGGTAMVNVKVALGKLPGYNG